jgi:hypothetical protein
MQRYPSTLVAAVDLRAARRPVPETVLVVQKVPSVLAKMILQNGPVAELVGQPWIALELTNEHTLEPVLRRIVSSLHAIFGDSPAEVFIPVGKRGLGEFELSTGVYIFVRGDRKLVFRMRKIVGVVNDYEQPVTISDAEVQPMIAHTKKLFAARTRGLRAGSFVRIADGFYRDYCGTVAALDAEAAIVKIRLLTKQIFLETPRNNLIPLPNVPANRRVFYYCPLVAELDTFVPEPRF